jgi:hypothetical protein
VEEHRKARRPHHHRRHRQSMLTPKCGRQKNGLDVGRVKATYSASQLLLLLALIVSLRRTVVSGF